MESELISNERNFNTDNLSPFYSKQSKWPSVDENTMLQFKKFRSETIVLKNGCPTPLRKEAKLLSNS